MIPPKILIVEDELLVAMDIQRRLESSGYTICGIAMSAAEAIEQAKALNPHLVLMDIQLQGEMDGIEAAGVIRTQLDLPVIFVTANADAISLSRAQATAPYNFLVKPLKERELRFSIEIAMYHHATQKQLREMREELERKVELRTIAYRQANADLKDEVNRHAQTVKDLEVARDEALSASRAKSQFLACMSHELRTPMNGILGMTEVLLDEPRDEETRDALSVIHDSAECLLGLISNLLDYSKAQAGKIQLKSCVFEPRKQFRDLLVTLEQHAREKKLQLTSEISPEVPKHVFADPLRIGQILMNLLGNAIKFTHEGEINLEISVRSRQSRRVCIEIAVSDTGIGIAQDRQHRIFEPFIQSDGLATRCHGGAGLGLTLCEQLVRLMEGRIWLKSSPGNGTTVTFYIWVHDPDVQQLTIEEGGFINQEAPSISAQAAPATHR